MRKNWLFSAQNSNCRIKVNKLKLPISRTKWLLIPKKNPENPRKLAKTLSSSYLRMSVVPAAKAGNARHLLVLALALRPF